jgi:hypothetical protein
VVVSSFHFNEQDVKNPNFDNVIHSDFWYGKTRSGSVPDPSCTSVSARASMNLITYVKYNIPICDRTSGIGHHHIGTSSGATTSTSKIKKIGGRRRDETVTYVPVGGRDQICGVKVSLAKWKIR